MENNHMRMITRCKDPSRITAFTGHRSLPWGYNKNLAPCIRAKDHIADAILAAIDSGKNTFLCGLALGADTLFAEEVLRLRAEGHRMYLVAAIPSEQQTSRWSDADRDRYVHIREQCDALYIHDVSGKMDFSRACIGRNEWMVDNSTALIALYDGTDKGGTARTVAYARRKGGTITIIHPSKG